MSSTQSHIDIQTLSIPERILLAEMLWDSIAENQNSLSVTEEQKNILNERLTSYHANPKEGFSWDQVKEEMK